MLVQDLRHVLLGFYGAIFVVVFGNTLSWFFRDGHYQRNKYIILPLIVKIKYWVLVSGIESYLEKNMNPCQGEN